MLINGASRDEFPCSNLLKGFGWRNDKDALTTEINNKYFIFLPFKKFMFKSSLTNWLHRFKPLFFAAR